MRALKIGTKRVGAGALLLAALVFGLYHPARGGLLDQASEAALKNGMKVILLEDRKAPVVTFQVWYRAGSRNEPWGKSGMAHVLEHMMFKGTENIGAEEFTRLIKENGGQYNAFTSHDFAGYFENLSSDHVEIAVRLESDRMRNTVFRKEEFQTEKMVVMEERRLRIENDPKAYLHEQVDATAFQAQPYHWPVSGWMSDLARITAEDMVKFYEKYYLPANSFIVVAGDFKREELLPIIEEAFGTIPSGESPWFYHFKEPPQEGERRLVVKREAKLPAIRAGYYVPNILDPDGYVLEVIATILSGGKSSRLEEKLVREKRLVIRAEAEYSLLSYDPSLFYLAVEPLPGKDLDEVERSLYQELDRLKEYPVEERELEKAKNQLEAQFLYAQDSPFIKAIFLARYEIVKGWREIQDYIPSIRQVSSADVQRVAKRYFSPENRTAGRLIPKGEGAPTGKPPVPDVHEEKGGGLNR